MKQAALFDGFAFDPFPFQHDDVAAPQVDVGGSEIADAFVVAAMVVVLDEGRDFPLEITRQEGVFQQDAVLQRLGPAVDLSLVWGWQGAPGVCSMPLSDSQAARSDET